MKRGASSDHPGHTARGARLRGVRMWPATLNQCQWTQGNVLEVTRHPLGTRKNFPAPDRFFSSILTPHIDPLHRWSPVYRIRCGTCKMMQTSRTLSPTLPCARVAMRVRHPQPHRRMYSVHLYWLLARLPSITARMHHLNRPPS